MFFQEAAQALHRPVATFKFDRTLLAVARGEVYRGEALHFVVVVGHVVGCGVHLGDDQVLLALVLLAQGHVVRLHLLTVAAPGRVELDQDVVLGVHDDVVEGFANHDLNRTLVVLWNWLGLDDGLDFSWENQNYLLRWMFAVKCRTRMFI